MRCNKCGGVLLPEDTFCGTCGAIVASYNKSSIPEKVFTIKNKNEKSLYSDSFKPPAYKNLSLDDDGTNIDSGQSSQAEKAERSNINGVVAALMIALLLSVALNLMFLTGKIDPFKHDKPNKYTEPLSASSQLTEEYKTYYNQESNSETTEPANYSVNIAQNASQRETVQAKTAPTSVATTITAKNTTRLFVTTTKEKNRTTQPETSATTTVRPTQPVTERTTAAATSTPATTKPLTSVPATTTKPAPKNIPSELQKYENGLVYEGKTYRIALKEDDWYIKYRSSPELADNVLGKLKHGSEIKVEYIYNKTWAVFYKNGRYVFASLYTDNNPSLKRLMVVA